MRMRSLMRSAADSVLAAALTVGLVGAFTSPAIAQDADNPATLAPAHTGCDPIAGTACLLPFPDDFLTVHDATWDAAAAAGAHRQPEAA